MPELAGVTHHWVDAGGLRMHVAEAGSGPPLLLVHGWPQHWYAWHRLMPLLAEHHRVLAVDLRGFGWTDAPPRGYEKPQLADDLAAALDALDIDRLPVVGHDWGAMLGFHLAQAHPERVSRLVAMNGAHPWVAPDALTALSTAIRTMAYQPVIAMPIVGRQYVRRLILPLAGRALRWRATWDATAERSYREQFDDDARVSASMQLYRTWLLADLPALPRRFDVDRFTTPTLVLHGEGDPVLRPALVRSGIERVPSLTLEFVRDAGHFVAEDQPEVVARHVLRFLRPERDDATAPRGTSRAVPTA